MNMSHATHHPAPLLGAIMLIAITTSASAQTPAPATNAPPQRPAATAPSPNQTAQPATAANPTTGKGNGNAKAAALSSADRKFMQEAAQGGMAEVQEGQMAAQKANDPEVKKFAEKMVADHSKANDKLKEIASDKGVTLPTDLPASAQRENAKLSKLSGAAFDREYMKHQVSDHKKVVSEFKSATKKTRDPDVKQFAEQTLPVIEEHLQMARNTTPKAK
jgi:putative membrane protein